MDDNSYANVGNENHNIEEPAKVIDQNSAINAFQSIATGQPVESSYPAAPVNVPKKTNRVPLVILIVVCVASLGSVLFAVAFNNHWFGLAEQVAKSDEQSGEVEPITGLTKEKAMDFLKNNYNIRGALPDGYVGKEITDAIIANGTTIVSEVDMIYSYDSLDELKEMAREKYTKYKDQPVEDFEIKEYKYYAIVTPGRIKGATSCDHGYNNDCDSLLSFKRKYYDYRQVHEKSEEGVTYVNNYANIMTKDKNAINEILRVHSVLNVGIMGHGNIYSYDFKDDGDKYVLTTYVVGVGANSELMKKYNAGEIKQEDITNPYAINIYCRRFAADKDSGAAYAMQTESGTTENLKSFPITEDEIRTLPGYSNSF